MNIENKTGDKNGVFKATENGSEIGELIYQWAGNDKFIIEHTEVNPDYKGKGIGKMLLNKAAEFARNEQVKIVPECPYAKKVMERSREYNDILA